MLSKLPPQPWRQVAQAVEPPIDLDLPQQPDAAQTKRQDPFGVALRIVEPERAAPGAAKHMPALDAQVLADAFEIGDQGIDGVVGQFA